MLSFFHCVSKNDLKKEPRDYCSPHQFHLIRWKRFMQAFEFISRLQAQSRASRLGPVVILRYIILRCEDCPLHYRLFCSIPGLMPVAFPHLFSCENQKYLQTMLNITWGQKCQLQNQFSTCTFQIIGICSSTFFLKLRNNEEFDNLNRTLSVLLSCHSSVVSLLDTVTPPQPYRIAFSRYHLDWLLFLLS